MTKARARFFAVAGVILTLSVVGFAQSTKVDLTGKWLFTVDTSAGPGTPTITLKQDGESWENPRGGRPAPARKNPLQPGGQTTAHPPRHDQEPMIPRRIVHQL